MSEILEVPYWMEVGLLPTETMITVEIDEDGDPISVLEGQEKRRIDTFSAYYQERLKQALEGRRHKEKASVFSGK